MTFTDHLGRSITLSETPKRIVSLVPSQTELLYDLGLDQEVVGITKFCVHPEHWFQTKTRVGGTKQVNMERTRDLQPDLIIANKEENTEEGILFLEKIAPVWISDVRNIEDAFKMIQDIGELVGRSEQASELISTIQGAMKRANGAQRKRILYLIWKDPYMAAGPDTFIHHMLEAAGFENALSDATLRYPELSIEQINQINPDMLLLSSEPFPFKTKHTGEVRATFPNIEVQEVNGELFSWYGSRMLKAVEHFSSLYA